MSHMVVQNSDALDLTKTTTPYNDLEIEAPVVMTDAGPRLRGSTCRSCGLKMLGRRYVCSNCMSQELEETFLGPYGNLYSHTTVHVSPKFSGPQSMGYVDLAEGVRVLALLSAEDGRLGCDIPVELVLEDDWYFTPTQGTDEGESK
jgi:uncharacterized protein